MSFFFFKEYNINSIENISLAVLWNYIYNNKYNDETLQSIPFIFWLKKIMSNITALPPPLSSNAGYINDVINSEIQYTSY